MAAYYYKMAAYYNKMTAYYYKMSYDNMFHQSSSALLQAQSRGDLSFRLYKTSDESEDLSHFTAACIQYTVPNYLLLCHLLLVPFLLSVCLYFLSLCTVRKIFLPYMIYLFFLFFLISLWAFVAFT
jgi:hypothetical protein